MASKYGYGIREIHGNHRSMVTVLVNTARYGWTTKSKSFKTEAAAKAWITRRMKELAKIGKENDWQYEIIELGW